MTAPQKPPGQRFSHVYLRPPELQKESRRVRMRLASLWHKLDLKYEGRFVREELGIIAPLDSYLVRWEEFFLKCEMRDLLDIITLGWKQLKKNNHTYSSEAETWLRECRRIFYEEQFGYTIDDNCGVHFAVDGEFKRNAETTILALSSSRYAAARIEFEKATAAMRGERPRSKEAIRATFSAVEALFKLLCQSAPRLGAAEIKQHLSPVIRAALSEDVTAYRAAEKSLASLCDWVDGVHFYRHEQGAEEPTEPTLAYTVFVLSTGAAYLRWLAEFDPLR